MDTITNYIDGQLRPPGETATFENIEPATGKPYSLCATSTDEHLNQAVDAAQKSFSAWSSLSAESRAQYLIKIADQIDIQSTALARAESIDTGKPIELATRVDIPRASANLRFFAYAITQFSSQCHAMADQGFNYTLREPLGVVACITPWNLPLYLLTWKIAPALASGNCVIAKPSEVTPMTAFLLAKICQQVELPRGVLNILHGSGADIGQRLCEHPAPQAISFTGGSATGKQIAQTAATHFKKTSLELGGKNPALVFEDCALESTVQQLVRACFANQGQICLCPSRLYVHRAIYSKFKTLFLQAVNKLTVGDPLKSNTDQGALTSYAHQQKVLAHIRCAEKEGGQLLCGGEPVSLNGRCRQGYFVRPTAFEKVANGSPTNQEEIFGPVVTLQAFDSDEQALALANDSRYGLSATLWTENLSRGHTLARKLEAGIVWVNCWLIRDLRTPFGGMKNSGMGREGGVEALRFFTESKNICVNY